MEKIFEKSNFKKIKWIDQNAIDVVILDSCINHLDRSIHNMVESKTKKVPEWIVNMVIFMLEEEIRD